MFWHWWSLFFPVCSAMTIIIMRMMMSMMSIMTNKAMINPSHSVMYHTKKDKNKPQSNDSAKNLNENLLFSQPCHNWHNATEAVSFIACSCFSVYFQLLPFVKTAPVLNLTICFLVNHENALLQPYVCTNVTCCKNTSIAHSVII